MAVENVLLDVHARVTGIDNVLMLNATLKKTQEAEMRLSTVSLSLNKQFENQNMLMERTIQQTRLLASNYMAETKELINKKLTVDALNVVMSHNNQLMRDQSLGLRQNEQFLTKNQEKIGLIILKQQRKNQLDEESKRKMLALQTPYEKFVQTQERELQNLREKIGLMSNLSSRDKARIADIDNAKIKQEALTAVQQHNFEVRRRAALGISLEGDALREVTVAEGTAILTKQAHNAAIKQQAADLRIQQRQILATTMAIFGMTMSIWQVTNAMSAMAGDNKELKADFIKLQAVMMGATGPILLAQGITQLSLAWHTMNVAMQASIPIMFVIMAIYLAMTARTKEVRIAAGALAGAIAALTIVRYAHAAAAATDAKMTVADTVAKIVNYAVTSLGTLLPVIAGAVIGAVAIAAMLPKAQTQPGQFRRMMRDGPIFAHEGEVVSRPRDMNMNGMGGGPIFAHEGEVVSRPRDMNMNGMGGGPVINLIVDGQQVDYVQAKATERNNYLGWGSG